MKNETTISTILKLPLGLHYEVVKRRIEQGKKHNEILVELIRKGVEAEKTSK